MNASQPLGLPEGSVRAILTLLLSVGWFVLIFLGKTIPTEFSGAALAAVVSYFAARPGAPVTRPTTVAPPK